MRWSRSKRNSVSQEKKSSSSSSSNRQSAALSSTTSHTTENGLKVIEETYKPNLSRNGSDLSVQTSLYYDQNRNSRSSFSISRDQISSIPASSSQASISSNGNNGPTGLIRTQTISTLHDSRDDSHISRSLNSLKLNSSGSSTHSKPFTYDNYDSSVIKIGWINKGSNITNWNNTNSDTWRVYKAELKGAVLSLYKLPAELNVKSFDSQINQHDPTQATSVRQKRLSTASSRANLKADFIRSPTTPTTPTSLNSSSLDPSTLTSKNLRIKLKYQSENYPHPDLQLNSSNSIVSGTLESICHTILFNTLDDDKLSYNLLLILPLFGDVKTSLKYFIEFSSTFSSQKTSKGSALGKFSISANTDYAITQRLGLVISTITDSFPGMLLDDDISELLTKLLITLSQHDEHLADKLKKSTSKKLESMRELTGFKKVSFDPNGSLNLTNVDNFLRLDAKDLANQINLIDLRFNKAWNPKNDPSLLYELDNLSYSRLNPLIFNSSSNIHYLGRLLVNHLFGSQDTKKNHDSKRALILSKWIELGCIFDKIGDMVSWLAIATTICSIPILRLKNSWSLVDEKFLKIISTEWAPVVFELDRRTMISEASHRSSYHVIAPQGLGVTYSKKDVVPYFGDLTVKYLENSTLKQCEKRVQRVKVSFSRWDEYLTNVEQDDSAFSNVTKQENANLLKQLLNLLSNHVHSPPLTQESVMQLSLSVEPDAIGQYYKVHDSRTPLITGSYLPTLFSEIVPKYRLFDQEVLIGASGFSTKGATRSSPTPSEKQDFQKVTGVNDIDLRSYELNSKLPSSRQHALLKSVRDIFNIGSDVFHVDDDLIFKSFSNGDEWKSSRPASVVLENPSSKRLSQISTNRLSQFSGSNRASGQFETDSTPGSTVAAAHTPSTTATNNIVGNTSSVSADDGDDVFAILDNANLLNSLIKPLNVVLKAGTFERMIDVLVLTSNVFSKKIDKKDIDTYLEKSNLLDNQFLKLKMNNGVYTSTFFATYRSFSTTSLLLKGLTKRFIGAKSGALSISRFNSEGGNKLPFPDWITEVPTDEPSLNWKFVGNVQIGVLEALSILVSDHYSDFTDDLQNRSTFVDLLRLVDNAILVEWKEILLRFEDALDLKNELNEIYGIITNLYKKIRKTYIKKCYRPLDLFPRGLPEITHSKDLNINDLKLPKDFRGVEVFIDRLDWYINNLFNATSITDWIYVFQLLEIQSGKSLTSLFKYKWNANAKDEEQLPILNIFSWLQNLFGDTLEDKILNRFPPPVKLLFDVHTNLEKFFKAQIAEVDITRDVRTSRMVAILQSLTISRLRMGAVDLFHNTSVLNVSPHVPSFIESAITQAIVSPESRIFVNSWMYSSSALKDSPVEESDGLLDLLPKLEVDDLSENLRDSLTPCVGWFTERLLEISNFVPNMSIENSKLVNFDKRRFTYNCITNIVDMKNAKDSSEAGDIRNQFDILLNTFEELDFKLVKEAAIRENKEYPKTQIRLFKDLIDSEVEKLKRDSKKKEVLENQERDIKRTQLLSQARASISINREIPPPNEQQTQLRKGARQSPSKVSGVGKRLGGILKSVRPFSINVGSTWSGPDKIIHPDDLPDVSNVDLSGKHAKPYQQIKLFTTKPLLVHSNIEGFFKIVSENGGDEYFFQALSNSDAQSWISALNLSKRYTYLSKDTKGLTSSKVFGVPIADVCEREGTLIPKIVEKLLQEIELRGLDETGLYRIPGSVGSINLLKQAFDEGGDFTLEDDRWFEINTLAGCFKSYLRELPETLFTSELLPEFVQATKEGDLVENLKVLSRQLPLHNYHLLKRLFEHLNKVIQHSENNRMDAVNLAIVFSMSFLNNDALGASMGSDLGALQNILQQLIKDPLAVFSEQLNDDASTIFSA